MILIAFILYFITLTTIGFLFYQKTTSSADFALGNRAVNYWVTAISTQASDMGSWLFLGFPAALYLHGGVELWTACGLIFFMLLNWHFIAPRLREKSEEYKALTLSSYFERHFHDPVIGLLTTFATIIFFVFYIASNIVGLATLFTYAFGISYHLGSVISLTAALAYTLIGGFLAVAWCDFFQGIFLLISILTVQWYSFLYVGGYAAISSAVYSHNLSFSLIPEQNALLVISSLAFGWGLGYFGQPHILTNFMGIKNPHEIRYAKYIGIAWQTIVLFSAAAIGITGIAYFQHPLDNPDLLFMTMTKELFSPFIAGLILCGVLAATLSTLDSLILISGSMIAHDLVKPLFPQQSSTEYLLLISRLGSLGTAVIALLFAWDNNASVYNLVNYAWAGLGSAFGPLVIGSLYSTKLTHHGARAAIITGTIISGFWPFTTIILPLVPGFIGSALALYLVSSITSSKQIN